MLKFGGDANFEMLIPILLLILSNKVNFVKMVFIVTFKELSSKELFIIYWEYRTGVSGYGTRTFFNASEYGTRRFFVFLWYGT